jgi:nitrate reductase gamma subunit
MTAILYSFIYLGVLAFLIGSISRAVRYAKTPTHLRWELYPVPHEGPERAEHGGSYFEVSDWWTVSPHFSLWGELKAMVPEMAFLKGLWEFNRPMWLRSFPFHFGLYLVAASAAVVLVAVLITLLAPGLMVGTIGVALRFFCRISGLLGAVLVVAGAIGLLAKRLSDENLKNYTAPGDVFNLLFFIATFGLLIAGYALRPPGSPGALALAVGLLTLDTTLQAPPLLSAGLILAAALAAYIPQTHMSHFVGKYFTYHSVRWDDQPSVNNEKLRRRVAEYLTYRPTWSAPHLGANGTKTWAEIATANPAQEMRK